MSMRSTAKSVVLLVCLSTSALALVPHKWRPTFAASRTLKPAAKRRSSGRSELTMYFDDVSRFSLGSSMENLDYHQLKLRELQRRIFGHTVESASELDHSQIQSDMNEWMETTAATLECNVLSISNATTVAECLLDVYSHLGQQNVLWVFPYCSSLYEYSNMFTMTMAIEYSKSLWTQSKIDNELHMFHPKYKNAPKLWSPARHSPFPSLLCQQTAATAETVSSTKQLETLMELERLFDTAAFVGGDDDTLNPLQTTTKHTENQDQVLEATYDWILEHLTYNHNGETLDNLALQYMDSVDEWRIESESDPLRAYVFIWKAICDIQTNQQNGIVLVTPNLWPFRASTFVRFAITVNAALKKLNTGLSLEVFHPEYIGKGNKAHFHELRRSPFPMIQIVRQP